jgi:acetyl-CoA carboxylase biotin carboxyl carrier protein
MWMNLDEIKELLQALSASDVAELELETDKVRIASEESSRLRRSIESQRTEGSISPAAGDWASRVAGGICGSVKEETVIIAAPMVGVFYRAPAPDAAPYVEVGDSIEEGQPLCIIEAMKLMNEIEADVAGSHQGDLGGERAARRIRPTFVCR